MKADSTPFTQMEAYLEQTLKPVRTPPELVHHLRRRIRLPEAKQIRQRFMDWYFLFVVASGLISVAVVLVTLARAISFLVRRKA
ncbi:MAG: hypothetical protein ACUVRJ_03280 [Candidatus Villigracilaceae bacterium]